MVARCVPTLLFLCVALTSAAQQDDAQQETLNAESKDEYGQLFNIPEALSLEGQSHSQAVKLRMTKTQLDRLFNRQTEVRNLFEALVAGEQGGDLGTVEALTSLEKVSSQSAAQLAQLVKLASLAEDFQQDNVTEDQAAKLEEVGTKIDLIRSILARAEIQSENYLSELQGAAKQALSQGQKAVKLTGKQIESVLTLQGDSLKLLKAMEESGDAQGKDLSQLLDGQRSLADTAEKIASQADRVTKDVSEGNQLIQKQAAELEDLGGKIAAISGILGGLERDSARQLSELQGAATNLLQIVSLGDDTKAQLENLNANQQAALNSSLNTESIAKRVATSSEVTATKLNKAQQDLEQVRKHLQATQDGLGSQDAKLKEAVVLQQQQLSALAALSDGLKAENEGVRALMQQFGNALNAGHVAVETRTAELGAATEAQIALMHNDTLDAVSRLVVQIQELAKATEGQENELYSMQLGLDGNVEKLFQAGEEDRQFLQGKIKEMNEDQTLTLEALEGISTASKEAAIAIETVLSRTAILDQVARTQEQQAPILASVMQQQQAALSSLGELKKDGEDMARTLQNVERHASEAADRGRQAMENIRHSHERQVSILDEVRQKEESAMQILSELKERQAQQHSETLNNMRALQQEAIEQITSAVDSLARSQNEGFGASLQQVHENRGLLDGQSTLLTKTASLQEGITSTLGSVQGQLTDVQDQLKRLDWVASKLEILASSASRLVDGAAHTFERLSRGDLSAMLECSSPVFFLFVALQLPVFVAFQKYAPWALAALEAVVVVAVLLAVDMVLLEPQSEAASSPRAFFRVGVLFSTLALTSKAILEGCRGQVEYPGEEADGGEGART